MQHTYKRKDSVKKYDLLRDVPKNVKEEFAKIILNESKNKSILDLGFGTGNILISLVKLNKSSKIYGIDNSGEMISFVKNKISKEIILFKGDLNQFKKKYGLVDVLHFKAILHCIDKPEVMIDKIINSVSIGGLIITSHEVSQTEDRIEQIFDYTRIDDPEVEIIFEKYFRLRTDIGKPFVSRKFPAGNSDRVVDYFLKTKKCSLVKSVEDKNLFWKREIKILDLLESIKFGTFGVFFDSLSQENRNYIYVELKKFCEEKNININKKRLLPCKFKINILRRKI